MRPLVFLVASTVLLAGCSDDGSGEEPLSERDLTEADCAQNGLELGHENGTAACVEPAPPASVDITGLPDAVVAYSGASFQWVLDTPMNESHAMRTEVRASTTSVAEPDKPDDYGVLVSQKEHQNFEPGRTYDATWNPTESGTYYLRAYALVQNNNIWSPEYTVEVTPVEPTGNVVTITITQGGPVLASADPANAEAVVGDAIQFQNDDVAEHTLTWVAGPAQLADITVAAGESSEEVVLLTPGTYKYESTDVQPFTGEVSVSA